MARYPKRQKVKRYRRSFYTREMRLKKGIGIAVLVVAVLAAVLCVPEDALSLTALDAERSRSRTTVYQVWVAQSSTWGAANHAAASTAATSTTMPMPRFTRVSLL